MRGRTACGRARELGANGDGGQRRGNRGRERANRTRLVGGALPRAVGEPAEQLGEGLHLVLTQNG
jgi:hypothetical protein